MLKDSLLFKSSFIISLLFHLVFFFPAAKTPQKLACAQVNYFSNFHLNPQVVEQLQELKKLEKIADDLAAKNRENQASFKTKAPAKAAIQTPVHPARIKENTHLTRRGIQPKRIEANKPWNNNQINVKIPAARLPNNKIFSDYYELVNAHLRGSIVPPPIFNTGEITISFVVGSDGSLKHLEIVEDTSPQNLMLKQTALQIIKNASPFPPFPEKILKMELTFNVTICFHGKT
ncbi:MAG: TonB family protein [Candidatus Omnitrophica bacterium]|nr:TonB family protein [Candidatus Omnitrophota bacterium]MBU1925876.1 TonB family protein [Candidatus Omnitrophota bacterium]